jgi:AraC family transcriptional regulator of adaptative response/methylated-DNA-[protein]-cysteine methyltransferase
MLDEEIHSQNSFDETQGMISQNPSADYARIACAIDFLRREAHRQPTLAEVAAAVHLSEFHFQRIFSRWAGVSPKRFLQLLTLSEAKRHLAASADLLSASLDAGLSSPGRLHDLFVAMEAVTPGEFKTGGADLVLRYGFQLTPFGECLIASTLRGVCFLEFLTDKTHEEMLVQLAKAWPGARAEEDLPGSAALVSRIFSRHAANGPPLNLLVKGTNFQTKVWRALLNIPSGRLVSYAQVAAWVGQPGAARAVGSAIGANPIAWLIPCHRVLRGNGELGGYAWGETRKIACLAWEQAAGYTISE